MASKEYVLDERTTITVYKRRTNRNLRLSVAADGKIRVSIPTWAPYRAGVEFAKRRMEWIELQRKPKVLLTEGQSIGKAHHLRFIASKTHIAPKAVVRNSEIVVQYPVQSSANDSDVQIAAQKASVRALRKESQRLLPQRLEHLAKQHEFTYGNVSIKQMKSRWGSCDQYKNIVLNLYLMQLPWELIDYVLLHELTHTKVLHHGPIFWKAMERVLPDAKQRRKSMLMRQPILDSSLTSSL